MTGTAPSDGVNDHAIQLLGFAGGRVHPEFEWVSADLASGSQLLRCARSGCIFLMTVEQVPAGAELAE